jgi:hypothetical protein
LDKYHRLRLGALEDSAFGGEGLLRRPMTVMRARRLVKVLLDRSLVSGHNAASVQLHDLVRDHAVSGLGGGGLRRAAHAAIVEGFRRARPAGCFRGWTGVDHPLAAYANARLRHHVRLAIDDATAAVDATVVGWLSEGVVGILDALPVATGRELGEARCTELAREAEAGREFWLAAVRWKVVAEVCGWRTEAMYGALHSCVSCVGAAGSGHATSGGGGGGGGAMVASPPPPLEWCDRLECEAVTELLKSWKPEYAQQYAENIARLLPKLGDDDPVGKYLFQFCGINLPAWVRGDLLTFGKTCATIFADLVRAGNPGGSAAGGDGGFVIQLAGTLSSHARHYELALAAVGFDWEGLFGEDGAHLRQMNATYDFHMHNKRLTDCSSFCGAVLVGNATWPLLLRYGDIQTAKADFDKMEPWRQRLVADGNLSDSYNFWILAMDTTFYSWFLGRRQSALVLLEQLGLGARRSGDEIKARIDQIHSGMAVPFYTLDGVCWYLQLLHVLLDPSSAGERLASLPEPEVLAAQSLLAPISEKDAELAQTLGQL